MNKPLLKQALDALEIGAWYVNTEFGDRVELDQCNAAIEALKAELAKPESAPVGYVYWNKGHAEGALDNQNLKPGTPLYAAPTEPTSQTLNCSRHPDAPHGPDGAGCKCHNWSPGEAS